jgi:hypothetical protein
LPARAHDVGTQLVSLQPQMRHGLLSGGDLAALEMVTLETASPGMATLGMATRM